MAAILTSRRTASLAAGALLGAAALTLAGCDEKVGDDVAAVTIAGERFYLEVAADDSKRIKGLGGRTFIEEDGGMLFAFRQPSVLSFVMRDCPIPIDILFLDAAGRVVAMHQMVPEEPRRPGESESAYEARLKRYSSGYPSQFVIEIRGGRLDTLEVKKGDRVEMDLQALKNRAR